MSGIVDACDEHDNCVVIESDGWPDQAGSWRSHFEDDVDPGERLGTLTGFTDRRTGEPVAAKAPTQRTLKRLRGEMGYQHPLG